MHDVLYNWISTNFPYVIITGILTYIILNRFGVNRKSSTWYHIVLSAALIVYMLTLLYVTLGTRTPAKVYRYNFTPFWSYKEIIQNKNRFLIWENTANIIAFIPFGMFLPEFFGRRIRWHRRMVIAGGISMLIEATQLFTKTGLCELDDVFHNTCGALIGYGIARLVRRTG